MQFVHDVSARVAAFLRLPVAGFYRFERESEMFFVERDILRLTQRRVVRALHEKVRDNVQPVDMDLPAAAQRIKQLARQVVRVVLLDIEIAVNVAHKDFVGAFVGGDGFGHPSVI